MGLQLLKLTKVVVIFKSGDDSDPNNYRPMSLLFFISYSTALERNPLQSVKYLT